MKVLQISNYYYPHTGGIEQVARDISNSLKELNIEQKIICFNEDAERDDYINKRKNNTVEIIDGVEVIRCGCFTKLFSQSLSSSYRNKLKNILNEFDPNIIIFHYPNPFVAKYLLKYIKNNQRLIIYWHLDIVKQKILGKLFSYQSFKLLEMADRVVATSPNYIEGSKYLNKYKNKCIVIPNCVSDTYIDFNDSIVSISKQIKEKYKDNFICFTIGRHIPYKGYEYLIKSSRYLSDDYKILIGGKGPLTNKLKKLANNNRKIEFLGFLSNDELKAYYLACDLICFSSITKNEAFGISLAEGMSFGKPAVTFNIPGSGVNYVNLNNVTGIECENKNIKEYSKSIIMLKENETLRIKYGKQARKRVLDNFSFSIYKKNIIKLIKENI